MATLTGPLAQPSHTGKAHSRTRVPALVVIAAAMLAGGCAGLSGSPTTTAALSGDVAKPAEGAPREKSELEKATEYWGKIYQKEPANKTAALNYAKNLRAMGQKQAAFNIVQQLSVLSGNDREVASEYGRLALDLDQAGLAAQALAVADDPGAPDWRVVSARGAAAAKLGQYAEAVPFFERALTLSPDNASLLNNLAMAHAANGEADRAEEMLRKALEKKPDDVRIRQNLGIVLGLKGQHEQARQLATDGPGAAEVVANAALLQKMVRTSAAPQVAAAGPATGSIEPAVAKKSGKQTKAAATSARATQAPAANPNAGGFADADADALIRKAIASAPAGTTPKAP